MLDKSYINFNGLATKHKRVTVLHMHYFGSHYRCCLRLYTRLPIKNEIERFEFESLTLQYEGSDHDIRFKSSVCPTER